MEVYATPFPVFKLIILVKNLYLEKDMILPNESRFDQRELSRRKVICNFFLPPVPLTCPPRPNAFPLGPKRLVITYFSTHALFPYSSSVIIMYEKICSKRFWRIGTIIWMYLQLCFSPYYILNLCCIGDCHLYYPYPCPSRKVFICIHASIPQVLSGYLLLYSH